LFNNDLVAVLFDISWYYYLQELINFWWKCQGRWLPIFSFKYTKPLQWHHLLLTMK